jgi:hypothetical protein
VRKRTLVLYAAVATTLIAPIADALRVAPLKNRDGVVLTWRAQNKVAVVAQPNGRMLAIHAPRRVTPGVRVTVQGIKWGTPTKGIKWSRRPQGIKWGIKWSRNGSYQSSVRRSTRRAVWTPVRGPIVKRFGNRAVAVGTPGGVVLVRVAQRRAQGPAGRPNSYRTNALPPLGATISTRVYFGKGGIRIGRDIRMVKPPVPGAALPVAGRIVRIDAATRTLILEDRQDRAYRIRFTVALPADMSVAPYRVGEDVAAQGPLTARGVVQAETIGSNQDFAAADDPAKTQVSTIGAPACPKSLTGCPNAAPPPPAGDPPPGSPSTPTPPPPPPPPTDPVDPPTGPGVPPPPGCRPTAHSTDLRHGERGPRDCWTRWCATADLTPRQQWWCRRVLGRHANVPRPTIPTAGAARP